jgi:hypothetical protein
MMKRGTAALVIAMVAVLAFAGTAAAQSEPLRYKTAKKLAVKLAKKQVDGREIVSYHVYDAERLNRNAIAFAYDDRTTADVFCTAVLLVRQRRVSADGDRRITARFRGQQCAKMPDDALAVEAATRSTLRALRATEDETLRSLRRVTRSLRRCQVDVPRRRADHVAAIVDIAVVGALVRPSDAVLGDFVAALDALDTSYQVLKRGVAGWTDWLAVMRSLPAITDPCATLRTWEQAGWAASEAPIDLAAYRALDRRADADSRAARRAARYLRMVGVFPRLVVAFTPEGLILRLAEASAGDESMSKLVRKSALH